MGCNLHHTETAPCKLQFLIMGKICAPITFRGGQTYKNGFVSAHSLQNLLIHATQKTCLKTNQFASTRNLSTMPYIILIFAYRKRGLSPAAFKSRYESSHVPLVQSIAGPHFPKTHTRRYIERSESNISSAANNGTTNANHPATVMVGTQADFDYDAIAELTFEDAAAFQTFFGLVSQPEAAEKIAKDEEMFLDRARTRIAVVDECNVATG